MPIKLSAPIEQEFVLEKADETYGNDGEPTRIVVRQATQAQNEKRSRVYSEVNRVLSSSLDDGETILRQQWSWEELKRMEVYLSLVDCNIMNEDGNPLFKFRKNGNHQIMDMTTSAFEKAWGLLPTDVAMEIHEKVMEVNLSWRNPLG